MWMPAIGQPVQVVCGAPNAARRDEDACSRPPAPTCPVSTRRLKKVVQHPGRRERTACCARSAETRPRPRSHSGILDLPADAPTGARFYALYAGLDDPVIEINLTPNRPRLYRSIHGIARDLCRRRCRNHARVLKRPSRCRLCRWRGRVPRCRSTLRLSKPADKAIACPYVRPARYMRGVKNGPSPRLDAGPACAPSALRPINAPWSTSPITSTFDRGRPLHVFDADQGRRRALTVRLSPATARALKALERQDLCAR